MPDTPKRQSPIRQSVEIIRVDGEDGPAWRVVLGEKSFGEYQNRELAELFAAFAAMTTATTREELAEVTRPFLSRADGDDDQPILH